MKILYFAWLREQTGIGSEDVKPPAEVTDVGGLIAWLAARSAGHGEALGDAARVRVAVNQQAVGLDHPVADDDEVAFFPPVTGG